MPTTHHIDKHPDITVSDADAAAIAALPEMMEALERLLAAVDDYQGVDFDGADLARSALAKAKGETP